MRALTAVWALCAAGFLAGDLCAGEAPQQGVRALLPVAWSVGSPSLLAPSGTSSVRNGFSLRYERILIAADHGGWCLLPIPGLDKSALLPRWLDLFQGPRAATAGLVMMDSRATQLPTFPLRALLLAKGMHLTLLPMSASRSATASRHADGIDALAGGSATAAAHGATSTNPQQQQQQQIAQRIGTAPYRLDIDQPRPFAMTVVGKNGALAYHVVTAHRLVIFLDAPLTKDGIGEPEISELRFYGNDRGNATLPSDRASVRRMKTAEAMYRVAAGEALGDDELTEATVFAATGLRFVLPVIDGLAQYWDTLPDANGNFDGGMNDFIGNPRDASTPFKLSGSTR